MISKNEHPQKLVPIYHVNLAFGKHYENIENCFFLRLEHH